MIDSFFKPNSSRRYARLHSKKWAAAQSPGGHLASRALFYQAPDRLQTDFSAQAPSIKSSCAS
jgi:hypothetical protein